jgi:SNF2 family DNA or RNA helicase
LSDSRKMLPYLKNPIKFWEMMAPKMVRRNYEDPLVLESLAKAGLHMPKTRIHKISCDLDPLQASLMVASINNFEIQYNEMSAEAAQSHHLLNPALVLSQMSRMRIAATCPEHFNKVLAKQGQPPIYHGPLCGGKLKDIKNLVLQKTLGGKKVFILSGFISTRDSLGKELAEFEPIVFNNKWDDDERREAFDLFLNDSERRVFIAGTLEIREGIDMSAADAVICTDLLWQPGLQCQAWSRILTPTSQERDCDIYLLLAKSTVDEHIYNTFYAKVAAAEQALDRKVINVRAESMDIRWFVSRVLDDRARIIEAVREAGEELVLTPAIQAVEVEERVL